MPKKRNVKIPTWYKTMRVSESTATELKKCVDKKLKKIAKFTTKTFKDLDFVDRVCCGDANDGSLGLLVFVNVYDHRATVKQIDEKISKIESAFKSMTFNPHILHSDLVKTNSLAVVNENFQNQMFELYARKKSVL